MSAEALREPLLSALRPRTLGERAMLLSLGGFSLPQLLERLPHGLQQELLGEHVDNPILGKREAVSRALPVLEDLVEEGRVVRSQVRMKNALVDTWRLSGRGVIRDLAR